MPTYRIQPGSIAAVMRVYTGDSDQFDHCIFMSHEDGVSVGISELPLSSKFPKEVCDYIEEYFDEMFSLSYEERDAKIENTQPYIIAVGEM